MRRRDKVDLVFEPEVERLLTKNRKQAKAKKNKNKEKSRKTLLVNKNSSEEEVIEERIMEEERRVTLEELYIPNVNGCGSSVAPPNVAANNFEIKPALTQLVRQEQFGGLEEEDPNQHIHNFLQICGTIKMNGVPDDAIRLRLFEFSLKGEAKMWLQSFPLGHFTTWNVLVNTFLAQYFPPEKYNYFRAEISCFKQKEGEAISEGWKRFNTLLRRCPHHGFSELQQIHIFYNGLKAHTRILVDASAGGSLRKKDANEARLIIETLASNRYESTSDFYGERRGVMELGHGDAILAHNKVLEQKIDALAKKFQASQVNAIQAPSPLSCNYCGGGHQDELCDGSGIIVEEQAQVNYMGNPQRNNFHSNNYTYHPHLRNHPNLSYKNNNFLQPDPPSFNQNQPSYTNNQPSNLPFNQNPSQFTQKPPFTQNPTFNQNSKNLPYNQTTQPRNAQPFTNMNPSPQASSSTQGGSSNL